MANCQEYGCKYYGGAECGTTNMMIDVPGTVSCAGSVECKNCYWMGLDGQTRFCSVGDHTSSHYCNYMYLSGFERKGSK